MGKYYFIYTYLNNTYVNISLHQSLNRNTSTLQEVHQIKFLPYKSSSSKVSTTCFVVRKPPYNQIIFWTAKSTQCLSLTVLSLFYQKAAADWPTVHAVFCIHICFDTSLFHAKNNITIKFILSSRVFCHFKKCTSWFWSSVLRTEGVFYTFLRNTWHLLPEIWLAKLARTKLY